MKKHLLLLICLLTLCAFTSCSDNSDENNGEEETTIKGNIEKLIIGKWALVKSEYKNSLGQTDTGECQPGERGYIIFGENGYYGFIGIIDSYDGNYLLSGNKITINTASQNNDYEILFIDNDSLTMRLTYSDDELSYELTSTYKRISFDADETEIKALNLIIGDWGEVTIDYYWQNGYVDTYSGYKNGEIAYWIFGKDYFIINNEAVGSKYYYTHSTWSLSNKILQIQENNEYTNETDFTILKLDKDSLIVRYDYPQPNDYKYKIMRFKRLSSYFEDAKNFDTDENGDVTGFLLNFVGEWHETITEYYHYGKCETKTKDSDNWMFCKNKTFYSINGTLGGNGKWSWNGNILRTSWTGGAEECSIIKLNKDSLILRRIYNKTDYYIHRFARTSTQSDLNTEKQKFVGKWICRNYLWNFSQNGKLYIIKDADTEKERCVTEKEWAYSPATETIVTTVHENNVPDDLYIFTGYDLNYSWNVTSFDNNSWTGKTIGAVENKDKEMTFYKIE